MLTRRRSPPSIPEQLISMHQRFDWRSTAFIQTHTSRHCWQRHSRRTLHIARHASVPAMNTQAARRQWAEDEIRHIKMELDKTPAPTTSQPRKPTPLPITNHFSNSTTTTTTNNNNNNVLGLFRNSQSTTPQMLHTPPDIAKKAHGYDSLDDALSYMRNLWRQNQDRISTISRGESDPLAQSDATQSRTPALDQLLDNAKNRYKRSAASEMLLQALRTVPRRKPEDQTRHAAERQRQQTQAKRRQTANTMAALFSTPITRRTAAEQQQAQEATRTVAAEKKQKIHLHARQTVQHLAQHMKIPAQRLLRQLEQLEIRVTKPSDYVDADAAEIVVSQNGFQPVRQLSAIEAAKNKAAATDIGSVPRRGPVVCVAGHVDHVSCNLLYSFLRCIILTWTNNIAYLLCYISQGKTTLLDALRSSNLAAKEAGGITQAIGAFRVDMQLDLKADSNIDDDNDDAVVSADSDNDINATPRYATFLDTPGHAAFTNLRARGISAACVDMMILVVSAVDGIQPQTIEAIKLATNNNVPIVVAINKCDLYGSDGARIQNDLLGFDVVTEAHGGDVQCIEISALKRTNLDELREAIALTAEMSDLRAPKDKPAQCYVIESKVDRSHGAVLNVVVRSGTLKVGDWVVSGTQHGRVRALIADDGSRFQSAGPSSAAQIVGLTSLTGADSELLVVASEKQAESIVTERKQATQLSQTVEQEIDETTADADDTSPFRAKRRSATGRARMQVAVPMLSSAEQQAQDLEEQTTLNLIIKCDVLGSLEALLHYIDKLPSCSDEVRVKVLRSGVGEVSEADLLVAQESKATVLAFGLQPSAKIENLARNLNLIKDTGSCCSSNTLDVISSVPLIKVTED